MAYHTTLYLVLFLPALAVIYQICPARYRWMILLGFSCLFYLTVSGLLVAFLAGAVVITWAAGIWLEKGKKKRWILVAALLTLPGTLIWRKYGLFLAECGNRLLTLFSVKGRLMVVPAALPMGLSFYTLQAIGYLMDIYRGSIRAEKNIGKLALFLTFFPTIMQGPICRWQDLSETLFKGTPISFERLSSGSQRIVWGLLKKMLIADRLNTLVKTVYDNYQTYDGTVIAAAAFAYTVQLYMEFSGCVDIAAGSGEIFGISIPENFRQPFFARNVSEFWRRWHITLGTWFKDYIFYPVSLSRPVCRAGRFWKRKGMRHLGKVTVAVCSLFPVWLCNGLWHGPRWNYIFYGLYYFALITLSIAFQPLFERVRRWLPMKDNRVFGALQLLRTWFLVVIGELFFRAEGFLAGLRMLWRIITRFRMSSLWDGTLLGLGMDLWDFKLIGAALIVVLGISIMQERNMDVRKKIKEFPIPLRWSVYYCGMMALIIFGAYGVGYAPVDLIYANF